MLRDLLFAQCGKRLVFGRVIEIAEVEMGRIRSFPGNGFRHRYV